MGNSNLEIEEEDLELEESKPESEEDLELEDGPESEEDDEPEVESEPVYLAVVGMNVGKAGLRIEAGKEVPASAIKASPWLLTEGHVRPRKGGQ
jgi:hypothetical protein